MRALPTPGFRDEAENLEPGGTEQITLRLPRRLLRHFEASGEDHRNRISAVLANDVDASRKAG